jgi:predicted nucleotidyltransferase
MQASKELPGSPRHQSLLRTIASFYSSDKRILAVLVFGSVARDTWDDYSDLDLAVVVRDGVDIDIPSELQRVSAALAERVLFTEVADDQGFLVLESLSGIAIRFHPLRSTDPYVLEGLHLLIASLDEETIRVAAQANHHFGLSLSQQVHQALWLALGADIMLQRRQVWRVLPWLEPMRRALLEKPRRVRNCG